MNYGIENVHLKGLQVKIVKNVFKILVILFFNKLSLKI